MTDARITTHNRETDRPDSEQAAALHPTCGTTEPDKANESPNEPGSVTPGGPSLLSPPRLDTHAVRCAKAYYALLERQGVKPRKRAAMVRKFLTTLPAPPPPAREPAPVQPAGASLKTELPPEAEKAVNQIIAHATGTKVVKVTQVKVAHKRRDRLYEALDNGAEYPEDVARDGIARGEAINFNERYDARNLAVRVGETYADDEGNEIRGGAAREYGRTRFPVVRG